MRTFLLQLQHDTPNRPIAVMSALAEGADQLVAEVALDLGLALKAVLPMPRVSYESDFATAASLHHFNHLCSAATELIELPLVAGHTTATISEQGEARTLQYNALGEHLCTRSDVLLALWDGKRSQTPGGTAWVVRMRRQSGNGPTYQVVCSRNQVDGAFTSTPRRAQAFWLYG